MNVRLKNYAEQWEEIYKEVDMFDIDQDDLVFDDIDADLYGDEVLSASTEWTQFSEMMPFVKEEKPGRNDACHCGSGKKCKKCCMDKEG